MYGQTDDIAEERKGRVEAVDLLLEVAEEKKTVADVRTWLEEHYPELVIETTTTRKW